MARGTPKAPHIDKQMVIDVWSEWHNATVNKSKNYICKMNIDFTPLNKFESKANNLASCWLNPIAMTS
jgi:hypothetical protein